MSAPALPTHQSPAPPSPPSGYPVPIERGGEIVAYARSPELAARLARALRPTAPRRLVGFKRKRMFLFDPAHAACFELRSGLVHATLESGETFTTDYSIRGLEQRLAGEGFFRAHRDVVVNLARVTEIERAGAGKLTLILDSAQTAGEVKSVMCSRPASARLRRLLRL